jgi:PAS domain S-box-containing protein
MMMLPAVRSIRQKLNFILLATTLAALLMAGIALVFLDLRSESHTIENDMVTQADIMALVSGPALAFDDPRVASENLRVLRARPNLVAAALYNANGKLFASYVDTHAEGAAVPTRAEPASVQFTRQFVTVWRPVRSGNDGVGMVYLQARHELLDRAFDYLGVLALVFATSLLAALLLSNRLQAALTGPLLAISDAARQIRHGRDLGARAPVASDDEVGELAATFNDMLDELALRERTLQEANQALRDSDARYQLAVRGSSAGLWDWDMAADTMFYSPRLKASLGYSEQEFPDLPSSLVNVMHEEDQTRSREALRAHLAEDAPYQFECRIRLKSGEWRWFLVTGMAQRNAAGRAFRMAGSVIDITERKQAEQVLQESNRAKDEFIATLAHELRNPLAPIRTGLEILKKDQANGPASQRARETMQRQLAHMIRLIDDLLDISRINSGKIRLETERIQLAGAIESAVELSRPAMEARGHELTVRQDDAKIELMADPTRLAQALGNLLNNAAKYTPPHGHVWLKAWQDGPQAVIEIADDGVGIPREMIDKVFALFTQVGRTLDRAQGGLGIGLYLVRSLVEMHRGTVTAESAGPGQGSRFTIRIPCLLQPAPEPTPAPEEAQPAPNGSVRVLVVDDNVDAAQTLVTVLEMGGRHALAVYEGEAVLGAAAKFRPDVVLLDIGLPGMSGYDVARQLRGDPRFARTVLVAVTGWGSAEDRRKTREAGFDEHLTKPVDVGAIEALLNKVAA